MAGLKLNDVRKSFGHHSILHGVDLDVGEGEFVVLVKGAEDDDASARLAEGQRVYKILSAELPPSRAAKLAAEITGASRKALYDASTP